MKTDLLRIMMVSLFCVAVLLPPPVEAGGVQIPGFYGTVAVPPPAKNQLPVLKYPGVLPAGVGSFDTSEANKLTIRQTQEKIVVDWKSFNIGSDAWVHFDQQGNSSWAALNRIYDRDPSLIYGKLTADGKIYLINQNGILFAPGSQVNVHTLVASAANMRDEDFLNGLLKFKTDQGGAGSDYPDLTFNPNAFVSNHGVINTDTLGSVFLIGPNVENYGVINTPLGQIGLIAGTAVSLIADPTTNTTRTALVPIITEGLGQAANGESGGLVADSGMVGMYGRVVNQEGLIRAVTAVYKKGQVELRATERITTGPNSVIQIPVSASSETADDSFTFAGNQQGSVIMEGLQTVSNAQLVSSAPPDYIEHQGIIDAPAAIVTMNATKRVLLNSGSVINVSGVWTDMPASAAIIDIQLNSVELRDAAVQKGGVLQGQKIETVQSGSAIGNIAQAILNREKTAMERAIDGGTVSIKVTDAGGDIVVQDGASIAFAGGGVRYSSGYAAITKLLSGTTIYDIRTAPANLTYSKIMGLYEKTYERYGMTENYSGIYYGGASALKDNLDSFVKGGNAGTLNLSAATVVLNGRLDGSATRGIFQNAWNTVDPSTGSAYLLSVAQGLEIPRAGTLKISTEGTGGNKDFLIDEIAIVSETVALPAAFDLTKPLTSRTTVLSSGVLNNANLGTVTLAANLKITTAQDAVITLAPHGAFNASARRIEHFGTISTPGGDITLTLMDNITSNPLQTDGNANPRYVALDERIFLASGSELNTAGQRVDNFLTDKTAGAVNINGIIDGGTITLQDQAKSGQGVFLQAGAVADVSGGYRIDAKGAVTAGNAGTLTVQGTAVLLDGDIRGYALADTQGQVAGGKIVLTANNITVTSSPSAWPASFDVDSSLPDALKNRLVLSSDRFADTGFTQIELNSVNDIVMESDTILAASLVRLNIPTIGSSISTLVHRSSTIGDVLSGRTDLVRLNDSVAYQAGKSGIAFTAGILPFYSSAAAEGVTANPNARIQIAAGAALRTAPEGTISLTANGAINIDGTLEALAGKISLKGGSIELAGGGRIIAGAYNRPSATAVVQGLGVNYTARDGGQVSMTGGDIMLEQGSLIDISGSDMFENRIRTTGFTIESYQAAGNPGSLTLNFEGSLTWFGTVNAQAKTAGVQGGTLTVSRTATGSGLTIGSSDLRRYADAGFDDITLKSAKSILFSGTMDASFGRKITLDAPVIAGAGANVVSLQAPWIELDNTSATTAAAPVAGLAGLVLSGQWLDVNGSIALSGFQSVWLGATRDIRLSDALYGASYAGTLTAAGDMTLKADRIFPTTYSIFTLESKNGKVAILPADQAVGGLIYSAGGNLTIKAQSGIDVEGTVAAPLGTITMTATAGRIYLADGSVVTTAGNAMVNYGVLDDNNQWWLVNRVTKVNTTAVDADNLPGQAASGSYNINLNANEVIVRNGALIDASGGGSVFAYQWRAGVEGSSDPLAKAGRYIVLSGSSIVAPGAAVWLEGGSGLPAGMYTLLDASKYGQYAFLPNAYIIEASSLAIASGQKLTTKEGYSVVAGYKGVSGTSIRSQQATAYIVRTAADVLAEGHYDIASATAGNAGSIRITGNTTVLDGTFRAAALAGYQGGLINLVGKNIIVTASSASSPLSADFNFNTPITDNDGFKNQLNVSADGLSAGMFREIDLGDKDNTNTVTVRDGANLEAGVVSLAAKNTITVESGAVLYGNEKYGSGEIGLTTPGTAAIQSGALLHASHTFNWNVGDIDLRGELQHDHSAFTMRSAAIYFVPDQYARTGTGLYLTPTLWAKFAGFEDIVFKSDSDIVFRDWHYGQQDDDHTVRLATAGSLTLDAARIYGDSSLGYVSVSLAAPTLVFRNSGNASTAAPAATNSGVFTATADHITIGGGDVLFGNFTAIQLNSTHDLILKGVGSLTTGNADLGITAAHVTTANGYKTAVNGNNKTVQQYQAADFLIYTGANVVTDGDSLASDKTITITASGAEPGTSSVPGGTLSLVAGRIDVATTIQVDGGTIQMTARSNTIQDSGINLNDGARILARGTADLPGGRVVLNADQGAIALKAGSLIDVSAGTQGDAGAVALQSPAGGVTIVGDLLGTAQGGAGGSFILYTNRLNYDPSTQLDEFKDLNAKLAAGGFTESADIRVKTGDVTIAAETTVREKSFKLTADGGGIVLQGTIDASGEAGGGQVELYAQNDVTLAAGSMIDVRGLAGNADGGEVQLASAGGYVNLNQGGMIDASASGTGLGGLVHLRALRTAGDVKMNLTGTVKGVSNVVVEAVKIYNGVSQIDAATVVGWDAENQTYMTNAGAIKTRLLANLTRDWTDDKLHLLPGVEARSGGDMTVSADVDLTSYRYGGEPGVVTLRAAGDLNISAALVDHPTQTRSNLGAASSRWNSWAINLAAGADQGSADHMATLRGTGDLKLLTDPNDPAGTGTLVYTESAPIRFASGRDTVIGAAVYAMDYMFNWMSEYNLGSYEGSIRGAVGRDLVLNGGAIQTAIGDIRLTVGRDVMLNYGLDYFGYTVLGSIRTTGQPAVADLGMWEFANYSEGGSIALDVGGQVAGKSSEGSWITALNAAAWDTALDTGDPDVKLWAPQYFDAVNAGNTTQGIVTMAGGNLSIRAGGDFLAQAGTFGQGNFRINAGGDIRGRFLVKQGRAEIHAAGNIGADTKNVPEDEVVIEAFDTQLNATAAGNIELGAIVNPTITRDGFTGYWDLQYTPDTSARLKAGGDVTLAGDSPYYQTGESGIYQMHMLPATLDMEAGGDIRIKSEFYMMPSPTGNLRLVAGGDIDGTYNSASRGSILVSDMAPSAVYTSRNLVVGTGNILNQLASAVSHNTTGSPLHEDDPEAIEIDAGGNIKDLRLYLSKKAVITAGGDILNIFYIGQNIHSDDVSVIRAGGRIVLHKDQTITESEMKGTGVVQTGPGAFIMQAGGVIDLGNSMGVTSVGNAYNTLLSESGSVLLVISGYKKELTLAAATAFFNDLRTAGTTYSTFMAAGSKTEAATLLQQTRTGVIEAALGLPEAEGGINMMASRISTSSAKGDIFIITNGNLDVGKSVFFSQSEDIQGTGVFTAAGGGINIFTVGDVNVNESRMMTFFGGDITVWSDTGNVNAGRGSKTAVNASKPKLVMNAATQTYVLTFTPPAVGSGIRAVTYDPDGASGPLVAPPSGDIYLFATRGVIDAGEAGIAGGKVVLAATQVLNVSNISFSSGSIGVPTASTGVTGIGTLSGSGSVAQASQLKSDAVALGAAVNPNASQMLENMMTRWLDVKVIDFILNE